MPMGIVSDDDFLKELNKTVPKVNHTPLMPSSPAEIQEIERGRGKGSVEVPDSLRKVIGETAITEGRPAALELARDFGISPSSVSAYTKGATSTASYDERPNVKTIDGARLRIQRRARAKLMLAINGLTPEVIAQAKARDLAGIARDMATVVKTMEPENHKDPSEKSGPTFIFYSPQTKKEESYDVVFAKD